MANSTLKTVGIIAGIYALWYIWRENKTSKALATPTQPAETTREILQKLITTNPLSQAPLLIDDIKVGAKAIYTPVRGFATSVVNTAFQQPMVNTPVVSTQLVSAPPSNFTGLAGLDGDSVIGFQRGAKGFTNTISGSYSLNNVTVPPTTGINQYCKCSAKMDKPLSDLAIFNR